MNRRRARLPVAFVVLGMLATCVWASAAETLSPLALRLGFGGTVTYVGPPSREELVPQPGLTCKAGLVIVSPRTDPAGTPYCIAASTAGLQVMFAAKLPFPTPKSIDCTELRGADRGATSDVLAVEARIARAVNGAFVYDGGRAACNLNPAFAYALTVETRTNGSSGGTPMIPAERADTRTLTIPWSLLHLDRQAAGILIQVNLCGHQAGCSTEIAQFVQPLTVAEGSSSLGVARRVYAHLATPVPGPAATPVRVQDIAVDGGANPDVHDLLAVSFDQDQSYVNGQRALSQALSQAPVTLPVTSPAMSIAQTLQVQSQSLFPFQMPSTYLEDVTLKPLVDILPFSLSRVGSLAAGSAYGYSADNVKGALFYGLQAPGYYAGGSTLTVSLATPKPSPDPSPSPTPVALVPTAAAPQVLPLRPPPPPAPFLESSTASVPPFTLALMNGFTGTPGLRDAVDALAFQAHVYENQVARASAYRAETVNLFGRIERDAGAPNLAGASAMSRFGGESATFTLGSTAGRPAYVQVRETLAQQQDDAFFAPSAGTITWISGLSGPVAHVNLSYASGSRANVYSVDLTGFRFTNARGDIATQGGWQASIPLPALLGSSGWLVTAGYLVQSVSDRVAALEQGLVGNYAAALTQVLPPSGNAGAPSVVRPQTLGNVQLLSPWLGRSFNVSFSAGYDAGTVTGCGPVAGTTAAKTTYQCVSEFNARVVGGVFLKSGALSFGITDTTQQGSITTPSAPSNLGTTGALPGSVTSYLTYGGCPTVQAAYTNAAFPSGVPLPQQGATLSGLVDFPRAVGALEAHLVLGYFNERTLTNPALNQSGAFATIKVLTPFQRVAPPCKRS